MWKKKKVETRILETQRWFAEHVSYEGEPYKIDTEQAAAVVDSSMNTIVVARAGSGKTRTIVAKMVYLTAQLKVKPEEMIAFVFNANAAKEINVRLSKMCVDGVPIGEVKIATTFHAFARKIVYEACGGKEKCGKILAEEKDAYILKIINKMMQKVEWRERVMDFIKGDKNGFVGKSEENDGDIEEQELMRFAKMMSQFINRAQQKYLSGKATISEVATEYCKRARTDVRERLFIEIGVECFRQYHWYLLDARTKFEGFEKYGTDFNLIVSWASKLILTKRGKVKKWLVGKKHILIDEYQDFSQLFLAAVEAIRSVADTAKLFVVGDDWQAINRFAGSEVEYFKEFEKYFPNDFRRFEITTNYRCDREIVDRARKFMAKSMKEKGRFRAKSRKNGKVVLVDPGEAECEYRLVDYDKRVSGRDDIYKQAASKMVHGVPKLATVKYVKTLAELIRKNRRMENILLLHRNNETNIEDILLARLSEGLKWVLKKMNIMTEEEYNAKVRVMTMHKSKGLEAEVVIILEADEGVIPKTHPDTRLYGVFGETEEIALDDQKRLFYVAITRAKKRLYVIHDKAKGEGFAKYLGR